MHERSFGIIPFREEGGSRWYLVLRQTAGHWGFPKGHKEDGETDIAAALREFREETGILDCDIISGFEHVQRYHFERNGKLVEKTVVLFLGRTDRGHPVPQHGETEEFAWLPYDAARERVTYPEPQEALDAAERFLRGRATIST